MHIFKSKKVIWIITLISITISCKSITTNKNKHIIVNTFTKNLHNSTKYKNSYTLYNIEGKLIKETIVEEGAIPVARAAGVEIPFNDSIVNSHLYDKRGNIIQSNYKTYSLSPNGNRIPKGYRELFKYDYDSISGKVLKKQSKISEIDLYEFNIFSSDSTKTTYSYDSIAGNITEYTTKHYDGNSDYRDIYINDYKNKTETYVSIYSDTTNVTEIKITHTDSSIIYKTCFKNYKTGITRCPPGKDEIIKTYEKNKLISIYNSSYPETKIVFIYDENTGFLKKISDKYYTTTISIETLGELTPKTIAIINKNFIAEHIEMIDEHIDLGCRIIY